MPKKKLHNSQLSTELLEIIKSYDTTSVCLSISASSKDTTAAFALLQGEFLEVNGNALVSMVPLFKQLMLLMKASGINLPKEEIKKAFSEMARIAIEEAFDAKGDSIQIPK